MNTYEQLFFKDNKAQSFTKIPPVVSKDKAGQMVNFGDFYTAPGNNDNYSSVPGKGLNL